MAGREERRLHKRLHFVGQLKKARSVCDGGAPFAHLLGDFGLREVECVLKRLVGLSLLYWIQVLALEVLRHRHHGGRLVVGVANHDLDLLPAGELRGAKPALACNQLPLALRILAHRGRLHETVVPEGLRKLTQLLLRKVAARLVWRALDVEYRQLKNLAGLHGERGHRASHGVGRNGSGWNQRRKPAAKPVLLSLNGSGGSLSPRSFLQKRILLGHQK